jgi:putative DNA primase/helicase
MTTNHTLDAALMYLDHGFSIIPLQPRRKNPHSTLLPNRTRDGRLVYNPTTGQPSKSWSVFQERQPTRREVEQWFRLDPNAGIGLLTGKVSGCIALDIDGPDGARFVAEQGGVGLYETPTNRTSRGKHILFAWPGFTVRNFAHKVPGLDLRGDGGYIAVFPTVHPSGWRYMWEISINAAFALCPAWLLDLIRPVEPVYHAPAPANRSSSGAFGSVALDREMKRVIGAAPGNRNDQLNRSAFCLGQLVAGAELNEQEVIDALHDAAWSAGLEEREIMPTILSGLNAGKRYPRTRNSRTR